MTDTTRTRKPQVTRLERSRDERILAGVAGGLGAHLGINAWWFRLAFLVLAFFGGFGVLVYIAAWLVVPDQGHRDSIASNWIRRLDVNDSGTIFGLVLVGIAAVVVITAFADISGTLVVAAVLFVIGMLLYRGDLRPGTRPPPTAGDDHDDGAVPLQDGDETTDTHTDDAAATASSAVDLPPPPPDGDSTDSMMEPPPARSPRERSMLGRLTLAIGLIVVAGMAFIDLALDRVEIAPVEYVAAAVAIVGIGLLVGGWIGRARWLIVIGALLIPALWVASFAPDNWSYSAGDVYYAPIQASDVQEPFEHGVGSIEVDLTNLSPEQLASAGTIEVSLGAGEMVILVPRDVVVDLRADVGFGEISGPFEGVDGVGIDVDRSFGSGDARMRLDVEVGAGVIRIREEPIQVDTVDSLSSERSGG